MIFKVEKYEYEKLIDKITDLQIELSKKDKVIDLMADVLNDFDYDKQCEECHTDICTASVDGTEYAKCIKEHFYKKVEELGWN